MPHAAGRSAATLYSGRVRNAGAITRWMDSWAPIREFASESVANVAFQVHGFPRTDLNLKRSFADIIIRFVSTRVRVVSNELSST